MIVGYRIIIQLKYAAVFPFFSRLTKSQRRGDERQGGNKGKERERSKRKKDKPPRCSKGPPKPPTKPREGKNIFFKWWVFNAGLVKEKKLFPTLCKCGDEKKQLEERFCVTQLQASLSRSSHKPPHILSFPFY